MPLDTNDISFSKIQTEFGGVNPISLNEYYAGGPYVPSGAEGFLGNVPTEGAISCLDLAGVTLVQVYVRGIASQSGFDIDNLIGAIKNDGRVEVRYTLRESSQITAPGILGGYVRLGRFNWDEKGNLIQQSAFQPFSTTNLELILRSAHVDVATGNNVTFTGEFYNTSVSANRGLLFDESAALYHTSGDMREGLSCQGPDGSLYLTANTTIGGFGNQGIMLIKMNPSAGTVTWAKKIQTGGGNTFSTKSIHYVEAKNEIVLVVEGFNMNPTSDFRNNGQGFYVWKFNTSGSLVHGQMIFPGFRYSLRDTYFITASDSEGNLYATGSVKFGPPMPAELESNSLSSSISLFTKIKNNSTNMQWGLSDMWMMSLDPWDAQAAYKTFDWQRGQGARIFLVQEDTPTSNGEVVAFDSYVDFNTINRRILITGMTDKASGFTSGSNNGLYAWTVRNTDATTHDLTLPSSYAVFQQRNKPRVIVMAATTKVTGTSQNYPDKLILLSVPYLKPHSMGTPWGFGSGPTPTETINYGRIVWETSRQYIFPNTWPASNPWSGYTIADVSPSGFATTSGSLISGSSFAVENIFPTNPL